MPLAKENLVVDVVEQYNYISSLEPHILDDHQNKKTKLIKN
jgi:hypothetical protein